MLGFIPTPQDVSLQVDSANTLTATGAGSVFDFDQGSLDAANSGATSGLPGAGYAPGGLGRLLAMVVNVDAVSGTTPTFSFVVQESSDNATWTQCSLPAQSVTAVGVVALAFISNKRYVRTYWTLGGTTPSITFDSYINPNVGN